MSDLKRITPSKLLWVDLEMTGLDPEIDRIVEVGALVTDWNFQELGQFESGVGQNVDEVRRLVDANPWYQSFPQNKIDTLKLAAESPAESDVQQQLLQLIDDHFDADEPVLLAGNSIHQDRRFIREWWPLIEKRLHYRMLDVSAWKVVMLGKYGLEFPKKEAHRALGDIRESIAELQFYLEKAKL